MHRAVFIASILLPVLTFGACQRSPSNRVVVTEWRDNPLLVVDGRPYSIRGVTFGVAGDDSEALASAFDELVDLNVNTIRLWHAGDDTAAVLDQAARHDIKVMVGFWLRHGQPSHQTGDRFDWIGDTAGRQSQWDAALDGVRRFRDHPAVLMWALGNEVISSIGPEEARIAHAKFLGRLASEVKKLDPNHPVASVGVTSVPWPYWSEYCEDLDLYGVNLYGSVDEFNRGRQALGIEKPFVITEFNATGVWDVDPDRNGARLETTDQQKYEAIARGWFDWILPTTEHLGGFVFHFEDTPAAAANWYSTHVNGYKRPTYWGIRAAFTGQAPTTPLPAIRRFAARRNRVAVDTWIPVDLGVGDPARGSFDLQFLARRAGDETSRLQPVPHRGALDAGVEIRTPRSAGTWILSALVVDDHQNLAMAQASVVVSTEAELTAGSGHALPFYVYRDELSPDNHFAASGTMGEEVDLMRVNYGWRDAGRPGTCIRYDFRAGGGWYGLAWLDPPGDWGNHEGGFNLTGAKTLSFLARGDEGNEVVSFGFGLISQDQQWSDTARAELKDVPLTRDWRRYSIPLEGRDLSRIKMGFTLFVANRVGGVTFFVDDVKYE